MERRPILPNDVSYGVGFFDRFAGRAAVFVSRAPFFAGCILLILVWVPTILFLNLDTWQLLINTATTIVTFLLVALLQNSQTREDQATQHKLNAVADALADLMVYVSEDRDEFRNQVAELRSAVGIEERESTSKNLSERAPSGANGHADR